MLMPKQGADTSYLVLNLLHCYKPASTGQNRRKIMIYSLWIATNVEVQSMREGKYERCVLCDSMFQFAE